ncbi:MAG: hypothetical protein ACFFEF_01005 [Candidatus Thorarchaeota archaeon]
MRTTLHLSKTSGGLPYYKQHMDYSSGEDEYIEMAAPAGLPIDLTTLLIIGVGAAVVLIHVVVFIKRR